MFVPLLVLRNAFRHKLRTALTVVGLVVAIAAFGLLRTVVDAWYAGAERELVGAAGHAQLDLARVPAAAQLRAEDPPGRRRGVGRWANWFGGVYAASATSSRSSRSAAPATSTCIRSSCFRTSERKAFLRDREGAIAGRKLADMYGWKVGDQIPLRGTIYPGHVEVHAARHLRRRRRRTDTSQLFFHWDYLNETIKRQCPAARRPGGRVRRAARAIPKRRPRSRSAIDATFRNSLAETLTETEKAFQLGFVAMTEAILLAIQAVSLRRHRDHHGGDGEHDGDDRARALRRIRDAQGARLQQRLRRDADLRRIARHRAARRRARHRAHVSDGGGVRERASGRSCSRSSRCREETVAMQLAARAGRRRRGGGGSRRGAPRASASSTACARSAERHAHEPIPLTYIARNLWRAQAHDRADRRRHGAGRVRVRDGADARRGPRADARGDGPGRQRRRHPRAARRPRCKAASIGRRRRSSRRLPEIAVGGGRPAAGLEGAGRADQPAEARDGQAVERRDPRRDAAGPRAAAAGALVEGRMFRPGTAEIVAGRSIARRLPGRRDSARRCASRRATGRWSACSTPATPASTPRSGATPSRCCRRSAAPASRRCCSGWTTPTGSTRSRRRSRATRACTLEAKREQRFYADQSEALSNFISYLGTAISVIFSIGAMIGAMITMYASVASRTGEIGTLRALGFSRGAILAAFLGEALLLGLLGGVVGLARRVGDAGAVDLDDELPDVRRARVLVHADAADRRRVAGLRARHGLRRRLPAGRARGADEDRRRAARRLKRHRARSCAPA